MNAQRATAPPVERGRRFSAPVTAPAWAVWLPRKTTPAALLLALLLAGSLTLVAPRSLVMPAALAANAVTTVAMNDNFFADADVSVVAGDTVIWENVGLLAHTATSDDGLWDSGFVAPGASSALRFETPGSYTYFCDPHPFMRGTIQVLPGPDVTTIPTPSAAPSTSSPSPTGTPASNQPSPTGTPASHQPSPTGTPASHQPSPTGAPARSPTPASNQPSPTATASPSSTPTPTSTLARGTPSSHDMTGT